ncbi:hypothetical protein MTO96_051705 [Rhipicephalus appendiculatus]
MASSRAVHEFSPAGAGSTAVGGPSVTPGHGFSPEGDSILAELQNQCEVSPILRQLGQPHYGERPQLHNRVFELVSLCSDMRADAATERGAALALQGQLVDARREIAGRQRQVLVAERLPGRRRPGRPGSGSLLLALQLPCFLGGPGAKVVMGATSMGPAVLGRVGRLVPLVLGRLALLDLSEWLLA